MNYSSDKTSITHEHLLVSQSVFGFSRIFYVLAAAMLGLVISLAAYLTTPATALADFPHYAAGTSSTELPGIVHDQTSLLWSHELKPANDWSNNPTESILVGDYLYMAVGDKLFQVSAADGTVVSSSALSAKVGYNSRLAYADGVIVVLLDKGVVEAHDAGSLRELWVSEPDEMEYLEATSTPLIAEGRVVVASAQTNWSGPSPAGVLACFDLKTGEKLWRVPHTEIGYKWAGAAYISGVVVIGDDGGNLTSYDLTSGDKLAETSVGAGFAINSTIQSWNGKTAVLSATSSSEARLVRVDVSRQGFSGMRQVAFGCYSTSTPTISGAVAYVGGSGAETYTNAWGGVGHYGTLAAVNLDEMNVVWSTSVLADGTNIPAEVKSAPLHVVSGGESWVYFTSNTTPGALYGYNENEHKAQVLYTPDDALKNYCMASPIADDAGNVYYQNDSGTLFKLKAVPVKQVEEPAGSESESGGAGAGGAGAGGAGAGAGGAGGSGGTGGAGAAGSGNGGSGNDGTDGLGNALGAGTPFGDGSFAEASASGSSSDLSADEARELNKPTVSDAKDATASKSHTDSDKASSDSSSADSDTSSEVAGLSGIFTPLSIGALLGVIVGIVLLGLLIAAARKKSRDR